VSKKFPTGLVCVRVLLGNSCAAKEATSGAGYRRYRRHVWCWTWRLIAGGAECADVVECRAGGDDVKCHYFDARDE
jgi:hypothetical protein